jgi:hypothetical protein
VRAAEAARADATIEDELEPNDFDSWRNASRMEELRKLHPPASMTQRRADDDVLHSCSMKRTATLVTLPLMDAACTMLIACLSALTRVLGCTPPRSSWPAVAAMAECNCNSACSNCSGVLQRSKASAASVGDRVLSAGALGETAASAQASSWGRKEIAAMDAAAAAAAAAAARGIEDEEYGVEVEERLERARNAKGDDDEEKDCRSEWGVVGAGPKRRRAEESRTRA